jgi:hypothetical protein
MGGKKQAHAHFAKLILYIKSPKQVCSSRTKLTFFRIFPDFFAYLEGQTTEKNKKSKKQGAVREDVTMSVLLDAHKEKRLH